MDLLKQTLTPHGLDTLIGSPALSATTQRAIGAGLDKTDTVSLASALVVALEKIGLLLGNADAGKPDFPLRSVPVTDYRVAGSTATAKAPAGPGGKQASGRLSRCLRGPVTRSLRPYPIREWPHRA
jgi:hypothetical protein